MKFIILGIVIPAVIIAGIVILPGQASLPPISNIPAYAVIEPSGCGYFKGLVKVRFDMFMTQDAPYYGKHYVYTVDWDSPEAQAGYPGEVDEKTGEPLDWEDYQKWVDSLPYIWVNTPFHTHFVYFNTDVADEEIKTKIAGVAEYFYALHKYCWDNDYRFIDEWIKVSVQSGTVREPFHIGTESKKDCAAKSDDIILRADEFDTRTFETKEVTPIDLNIGDKGTIDIGPGAEDRGSNAASGTTRIDKRNPANADGTIDTVELWFLVSAENCEVATFEEVSSDTFTSRDSEDIGSVSSGSKQEFTGLSMDVATDDYIGCHYTAGAIEMDTSGGIEVWYKAGDQIPCTETYFSSQIFRELSIYGTGTEGVVVGYSWGTVIG